MGLTYDPVTRCSGGQLPGMTALAEAIYAHLHAPSPHWPPFGYNCRPKNGANGPIPGTVSVHGGGRALDVRCNATNPAEKAWGDHFADWLVYNATTLGVQCVIWDRRIWGGANGRWKWRSLSSGAHPHRDHIHFELTADAGRNLTEETIMSIIANPADRLVAPVLAKGRWDRTGRYPLWLVWADGRVEPQNGAPDTQQLDDYGIASLNEPITHALLDGDWLVLYSHADNGTFALAVLE